MPNRVSANFVKAQAKLVQAFQSSELRFRYPATYLALKQTSKKKKSLMKLKASSQNTFRKMF